MILLIHCCTTNFATGVWTSEGGHSIRLLRKIHMLFNSSASMLCANVHAFSYFQGGISVKVLVLGSGAREHALVWKLALSRRVTHVYAAPGNPGMFPYAECIPFNVTCL